MKNGPLIQRFTKGAWPMKSINLKDVVAFAVAILIAVTGYFINARLTSIDNSIKDFNDFQRSQIQNVEGIRGDINLLKAKDLELEKKIDDKIKR